MLADAEGREKRKTSYMSEERLSKHCQHLTEVALAQVLIWILELEYI